MRPFRDRADADVGGFLRVPDSVFCFLFIFVDSIIGPSTLYCLFTGVSVHDSVFDFSHHLTHSWPRERSSAIRNL